MIPFIIERIMPDVEKHSSILSLNNGTIHKTPESVKPPERFAQMLLIEKYNRSINYAFALCMFLYAYVVDLWLLFLE